MSHTSTISSIDIEDINALVSAINELKSMGVNCDLLENKAPRAWSTNQEGMGVAPFVVKLNDAEYDIGLYAKAEGGYEARTDFYGGSVEHVLGAEDDGADTDQAKLGKLYQLYGKHAITRKAMEQGYSVSHVKKEDGSLQLQIAV